MSEAKHSDGKITYERLLATYQDRTVARVAFAQLGGQPYHGTRKENDRDYHLDLEYVASAHIAGIIDGPVLAARIAHLEAVNAQLLAACEAAFVFLNGQYVTGDPAHAIAVESELDAAIKTAKGE